jgi:hypothetical protein
MHTLTYYFFKISTVPKNPNILVKTTLTRLNLHASKSKAIPVTGRGGPQNYETSRLPHFIENQLTDGGEFDSLKLLPHLYPKEDFWYKFLLQTESTLGP